MRIKTFESAELLSSLYSPFGHPAIWWTSNWKRRQYSKVLFLVNYYHISPSTSSSISSKKNSRSFVGDLLNQFKLHGTSIELVPGEGSLTRSNYSLQLQRCGKTETFLGLKEQSGPWCLLRIIYHASYFVFFYVNF